MREAGIFNVPFGKLAGGVVCAHCGKLLANHAMTRLVLPFELGGDTSADNIVYLCEECDSSLGFTVNIQKAFPYISVRQCERIMDYIDSRLTHSEQKPICSMCGTVVDKDSIMDIGGYPVPMCDQCKEKMISDVLMYAPSDMKEGIKTGGFEAFDGFFDTGDDIGASFDDGDEGGYDPFEGFFGESGDEGLVIPDEDGNTSDDEGADDFDGFEDDYDDTGDESAEEPEKSEEDSKKERLEAVTHMNF